MSRIPLRLKLAYSAWMAVWVPVYWIHNGPDNFLWFCDAANFVIGVALWLESPLLLSSQAVGVLLIQILWAVDLGGRLLLGVHPIGGTEYMFDPAKPLWLRGLSLFHLAVPPLLLWGLGRLGYDRRGWLVQSAFAWLILPATFFLTDPARNINWLWEPFGVAQTLVPPVVFLVIFMALLPWVLYLPSHLALSHLFPHLRTKDRGGAFKRQHREA